MLRHYLALARPKSLTTRLPRNVLDLEDALDYLDRGEMLLARLVVRHVQRPGFAEELIEQLRDYPARLARPLLRDLARFAHVAPFGLLELLEAHPALDERDAALVHLRRKRDRRLRNHVSRVLWWGFQLSDRDFVVRAMLLAESPQATAADHRSLAHFLVRGTPEAFAQLWERPAIRKDLVDEHGLPLPCPPISVQSAGELAQAIWSLLALHYLSSCRSSPCPELLARALHEAAGGRAFGGLTLTAKRIREALLFARGLPPQLYKDILAAGLDLDPVRAAEWLTRWTPYLLVHNPPVGHDALLEVAIEHARALDDPGTAARLVTALAAEEALSPGDVTALLELAGPGRPLPDVIAARLVAHPSCPEPLFRSWKARLGRAPELLASPHLTSTEAHALLAGRVAKRTRVTLAGSHPDPEVILAALGEHPAPEVLRAALANPGADARVLGRAGASPHGTSKALARYYHDQLGEDERVWAVALALMEDFDGSAHELVEAAKALSVREGHAA